MAEIQGVVAQHYHVTIRDLKGPIRVRSLAHPRMIAMYLCRELTPASLPQIGAAFGGRDHTTALHAVRRVQEWVTTDSNMAKTVDALRQELTHKETGV